MLASSNFVGSSDGVIPLFIGAAQVCSNSQAATGEVEKYQLCAHYSVSGRGGIVFALTPFEIGLHETRTPVIVSQSAKVGQSVPFWDEGYFNHEAIIWPAGIDTYEQRKALVAKSRIKIGKAFKR